MSESNSAGNTAVSGEQDVSAASRTGPRGVALAVYRWGLLVFLAAGVVQIFLAGLGTFRLLHGAGDSAFDPHRTLGFAMAGIAIIMLILTLIARPGARAIAGAVLLVLLTSFVQSLLAGLADVAEMLASRLSHRCRARRRARSRAPAREAASG